MKLRTVVIIYIAIFLAGGVLLLAVRKARLRRTAAQDLADAASAGYIRRLKAILDKRPDLINARVWLGGTALFPACQRNEPKVIAFLIDRGADLNARDDNGQTALFVAVEWARIDAIEVLLANGADINAQDNKGRTPLHIAVEWARIDAIEVLLANGADANVQDNEGRTPLHIAVTRMLSMTKLLLEGGADVHIEDNQGKSALELAETGGNVTIRELVREYAKQNEASSSIEGTHSQTGP